MKNLKTITLTICLAFIANISFAQGINWFKGSFEEAKALAKKENKLIFFYSYTTWWGPCKGLKKDVFPSKEVGKVFNKYFINFGFDAEKTKENRELAKHYKVKGFPTLLFINPIFYQ